jgi:acyl-CoA-binding protein
LESATLENFTDHDWIDRVFGHALNTVKRIKPGTHKPPPAARLALYGLYKQAMEGDVALTADPPSAQSGSQDVKRDQEKYDAWKANEGLSRTEAKRRYIETLIETMHKYASTKPEARELVVELEFVWDQIKNNSQHSSSEHSSPGRNFNRQDYMNTEDNGNGITASTAALDRTRNKKMAVLSPQSLADEDEAGDDGAEEFVDAPISQVDDGDLNNQSESGREVSRFSLRRPSSAGGPTDNRWRKRIESTLMKLTIEVAALREQLETSKYLRSRRKDGWVGWLIRAGWWSVQFLAADALILWIVILYLRRRDDRRLEGAIRVLLGDAVAQVQNLGTNVKMPALPKIRKAKE